MAMSTAEFTRTYNSWDLNQRLNWLRYTKKGKQTPAEEDAVIKSYVKTHYGAMGSYLGHPEIGPILMRSAREGWAPEQLEAALQQTTWWKTHTSSQREFDLLARTDPKEAEKKVTDVGNQIIALLEQEGVRDQFSDERIATLAVTLARNGASGEDIPRSVLAELEFAPTQPIGRLGARMTDIKTRADDMLIPLSDQTAFEWAKKVETGMATQDAFDQYVRETAKGAWGHLADRIDSGFTVKQLLEPQIQTVAGLLERDADSIDFRDPRFSQIISHNDGTTTREMTISEAGKYVRGLDEYYQTQGAETQVAGFVTQLASQFGKRA